jgi:hypothetical protein
MKLRALSQQRDVAERRVAIASLTGGDVGDGHHQTTSEPRLYLAPWLDRGNNAWLPTVTADVALSDELGELHPMIHSDHFGGLLADHNAWCVRVAADHLRHDACVRHPQPLHPEHP